VVCVPRIGSARPGVNSLHEFSLFIRYDGGVGNARTCVVSFIDSARIRHSVEVAAESLYEAAALAVNEFRRHPWTDGMEPGAVTRLAVSVNAPQTTHELSIRQLEKWVASSSKSPSDAVLKARIRALLDRNAASNATRD
jgi:hypothetical protein